MSLLLNEEQQHALNRIKGFINSDKAFFVLVGYAGTGKTTLVSKLVQEIKVHLTATTNKAAHVLSQATNEPASTIHRFLGLKPRYGKLEQTTPCTTRNALVLVDESSMIDEDLLEFIKKNHQTHNNRYILVGDPTQLPPVTMDYSPVFYLGKDVPASKLTTIMRQEDSPLQELVISLRKWIEGSDQPDLVPNGADILCLNEADFETAYLQSMLDPNWHGQKSKYISWTNKKAIQVNHRILTSVRGTPLFHEGDLVNCNRYIKNNDVSISTDSLVYINSVDHGHEEKGKEGCYVEIEGEMFFSPYEPNAVAQMTQLMQDVNDYDGLRHVTSKWIDLRHAYGITVHKAQGHTFEDVFIDLGDIRRAKYPYPNLYKRLLYVATSRASRRVIFKT